MIFICIIFKMYWNRCEIHIWGSYSNCGHVLITNSWSVSATDHLFYSLVQGKCTIETLLNSCLLETFRKSTSPTGAGVCFKEKKSDFKCTTLPALKFHAASAHFTDVHWPLWPKTNPTIKHGLLQPQGEVYPIQTITNPPVLSIFNDIYSYGSPLSIDTKKVPYVLICVTLVSKCKHTLEIFEIS